MGVLIILLRPQHGKYLYIVGILFIIVSVWFIRGQVSCPRNTTHLFIDRSSSSTCIGGVFGSWLVEVPHEALRLVCGPGTASIRWSPRPQILLRDGTEYAAEQAGEVVSGGGGAMVLMISCDSSGGATMVVSCVMP